MNEKEALKVLVVDDEKIVRDFLIRLLGLKGIKTKAVENGLQAIEAVKQEKFDLAFMDVRMPNMDGLETFRELKKLAPDLRCVMMTGYAVDDVLKEAEKEGAITSLKKPFDISQIITLIKSSQERYPQKLLRILIIDDDENILNFFKALLKGNTYELNAVKTAREALEQIKEKEFDLVFLDIVLKDANGMELYEQMRQAKPGLEVILITGYPEKAVDLPSEGSICLYKPFEIDKIFGEIERVRGLKGGSNAGREQK